jgi:hypothetical protein
MSEDRRYNAIKSMVEDGSISTFKEIFEVIPKTLVSKDMGMNYQTFTRKVTDPDLFTVREVLFMSNLFGVSPDDLFKRIMANLSPAKKKGK